MQKFLVCLLILFSFSVSAGKTTILFGDDSCNALRTKLEREIPLSLNSSASCGKTLPRVKSNLVIFVLDSTNGLMPESRNQLAQLKARGGANMAIVLTNTYFVDDAELLALVHMELIEYMNQLDLPTDKIPTFLDYEKSQYDSNDPTMPIRKGISQIVGFVKRQK
ncbi:hypothetical protein HV327_08265 [Citrobacter freundii]|jgi:hypothetical protein|uniref:hypothetical protein n=1 Tax=Citrobacter freundii TaxID=546 RepID=UPI0015EACE5C|nr:hypothetical protein [Citrobacter freundii]QLS05588.1 hypothetical protein HV327_08265 [Citrobacter freundii]